MTAIGSLGALATTGTARSSTESRRSASGSARPTSSSDRGTTSSSPTNSSRSSRKAETGRLGNENSEDALSFNVFRSLQEAGALGEAARLLAGADVTTEPELIVWGRRVCDATTQPAPELHAALTELETWRGQKTEPDVILRVPGWGWIFVEAKLASPTSTFRGKPEKLKHWANVYGGSGIFDLGAIEAADHTAFPEQLLRNVAVAHRMAGQERAAGVALVRHVDAKSVEAWAAGYLADESSSPTRPRGSSYTG